MVKKFSNMDVAKINRNRIYRNIYFSDDKMTVNELVKRLKLSRPTVESNIKKMMKKGLIVAGEQIESTGGRKPTTLEIADNHKYVIGCTISYSCMCIGLVNLLGEIVEKVRIEKSFESNKVYYTRINTTIEKLIKSAGLERSDLLGIGVVIPGPIDNRLDDLVYAPTLAGDYIDTKYIKDSIELDVNVINDVSAIGRGIHFFNLDEDDNKVYLNIARGIGGFIWSDKDEYVGDNGIAGEFGHMKIVPKGKLCHCKRRGCLEAYISTSCISDELGMKLEDFFEKLDAGDEKIKEKWLNYLEYLSIGIANIYCIFNCKVVISGDISRHLLEWKADLDRILEDYVSFKRDSDNDIYYISKYNEDDIILGSCVYYISEYINKI